MRTTLTVEQAKSILKEMTNGTVDGISGGKNGRAWLTGEFDLSELEAICVLVKNIAGSNAQDGEQLIAYWKENGMTK